MTMDECVVQVDDIISRAGRQLIEYGWYIEFTKENAVGLANRPWNEQGPVLCARRLVSRWFLEDRTALRSVLESGGL